VLLTDIQKLQFSNKERAEDELLHFLKQNEDSSIAKVDLTPKAESLNSINGFVSYENGECYFFKAHVEENEKISEYYNAQTLANAGYPVMQAKQISHRPGKQIAVYEIISLPTLFDLLKVQEDAELNGASDSTRSSLLLFAQTKLDQLVFKIYKETLHSLSGDSQASAPIHQLFFHRLAEDGRLGMFYRNKELIADQLRVGFNDLAKKRWRINGVSYSETINQIIDRARLLLAPSSGPAVIGHGDAHNGNIFVNLDRGTLNMFDPAFAGAHSPLLDMVKPIFHNIFARWMYYPEQVKNEFEISYRISDEEVFIEHSFTLSAMRLRHYQCKLDNLFKPTIAYLQDQNILADDWREIVKSALFCCPFLTVNLFAKQLPGGTLAERYPLAIRLLGLSMAVEFGASTHKGSSYLTDTIDRLCS
jgi:hypothetical protein